MNNVIDSRERFRRGFVLIIALGYVSMFVAMISGFAIALLLAAVFSGIVYPLYDKLQVAWGGRKTLASLVTLLITVLAIDVPLLLLLSLIADQAMVVFTEIESWIEQQINNPAQDASEFLNGLPFASFLEPYQDKITARAGEFTVSTGLYLAASLGELTESAAVFLLNFFVMLYAMFFFFISGPALVEAIMSYTPFSQAEKEKMFRVGLSVSRATVKGTLIIGIIQGTLGGLGFAVAGLEAAVFWGAVMAVLSILPGIGAMLVWAPAVVYLLLAGETVAGLGLLAWSAGVVGTVDNFLRPMLVGRDTEMPDLLILLSTLGGLGLFGAAGLVLGPLLAALFITVLAIYRRVFADWLDPDEPSEDGAGQ